MGKMNVSKHHSIWAHLPTKLSDVLTSLYNTIICIENAWCTYVVLCMHIAHRGIDVVFTHPYIIRWIVSLDLDSIFFQNRNFFRCVFLFHTCDVTTYSLFLRTDFLFFFAIAIFGIIPSIVNISFLITK